MAGEGYATIALTCRPWYPMVQMCLDGRIVMIEHQRTAEQKQSQEMRAQNDTAETQGVDMGRRAAMLNIGALAGAAPAVAVLLTPSASRAAGTGSPCEEPCGSGRGPAPGYKPVNTGAPGSAGFLGKRES
ncbi:MAG: hypothetical protein R3D80_03660 [Paracoccaceae bacterium]